MIKLFIARITEKLAALFLSASKDFRITDPTFSNQLRTQAYKMLGLSEGL